MRSLQVRINLPDEVQQARRRAEELRIKAKQYNSEAASYSRESVILMRNQGFSQKDIAAALGISRQRVAQLASGAKAAA